MSGVATAIVGSAVIGAYASDKASSKAARAQKSASERQLAATEKAAKQAREDITNLFPQATDMLSGGYQGAMDLFKSATPQQMGLAQQGNVQAQQTLLNSLPQMQAALLGGSINPNALGGPQQLNYDLSFLQNAQLPNVQMDLSDAGQQATSNQPQLPQGGATLRPGGAIDLLKGMIGG